MSQSEQSLEPVTQEPAPPPLPTATRKLKRFRSDTNPSLLSPPDTPTPTTPPPPSTPPPTNPSFLPPSTPTPATPPPSYPLPATPIPATPPPSFPPPSTPPFTPDFEESASHPTTPINFEGNGEKEEKREDGETPGFTRRILKIAKSAKLPEPKKPPGMLEDKRR